MNREIIFRGKIIDNGEWAYGSLVVEEDKYYIALNINDNIKRDDYDVYMLEVIPKTVGQYAGLYDKNGKAIWEGDIVAICFQRAIKRGKAVIKYIDKFAGFVLTETGDAEHEYAPIGDYQMENFEVIGNIYDNPELLGEKE